MPGKCRFISAFNLCSRVEPHTLQAIDNHLQESRLASIGTIRSGPIKLLRIQELEYTGQREKRLYLGTAVQLSITSKFPVWDWQKLGPILFSASERCNPDD